MTTTISQPRPRVIETRYVWGPTITETMALAQEMETRGWVIHGNPAPMVYMGHYGLGISITREANV